MTTRRIRGAPAVLGALMLLALTCAAPIAHAADPDMPDGGGDGWKKVLAYARCGVLVFLASTPSSWAAAFFDCAHTYMAESPIGGAP